MACFIAQTKRR